MIVLTVTSFNGAPVSIAPVNIDEIGGTIGRVNTNQLVLPDVDRIVSRVHAQIAFRSGQYALIDRGSNPVLHNGAPIGNGREVLLVSGDEIQVGGYLIKVSTNALIKSDDPFAEFDTEGAASSKPVATKAKAPSVAAKTGEPVRGLGHTDGPVKKLTDGIPDDWDPFRPDPPSLATNPNGKLYAGQGMGVNDPVPPVLSLAESPAISASAGSLDELFGLKPGATKGDPLAGSSLQVALSQPNTANGIDSMRSLLEGSAPVASVTHDHDSELQMPWQELPIKAKVKPVALPTNALPGVVLSWDTGKSPSTSVPSVLGNVNSDLSAEISVSRGKGVEPQKVENHDLLQAFLNGLGTPTLRMQPMNTETMFQLGELLRESVKGTVDLLAARTALKKEVRAAVTVMVSTSNNALKFSPSVEFALQYLLAPPTAGFMGPLESMRDAYDDLKAHQLGVMAGMRAVLSDVLKRFDPAILEEKLVTRGNAFSLMPSGKKARLWELFQELFGQLAHEAEEDFDELFGKAFVREYERYVAELNSSKST